MEMEIDKINMPAHWASYIVNADCSGLDDNDIADCDAYCESYYKQGYSITVDGSESEPNEPFFGSFFFPVTGKHLGCDLLEYTIYRSKQVAEEKLIEQKTLELQTDLERLKAEIEDDYIAEDDERPGIDITVASNDDLSSWALQTGDNSYTGACYGLPHWGASRLYRDSDAAELAKDLIEQVLGLIATQ